MEANKSNKIRERVSETERPTWNWRCMAGEHTHTLPGSERERAREPDPVTSPVAYLPLWTWSTLGYIALLLFWEPGIQKVISPRNWSINSSITPAVHDVMMWNTDNKIIKLWEMPIARGWDMSKPSKPKAWPTQDLWCQERLLVDSQAHSCLARDAKCPWEDTSGFFMDWLTTSCWLLTGSCGTSYAEGYESQTEHCFDRFYGMFSMSPFAWLQLHSKGDYQF